MRHAPRIITQAFPPRRSATHAPVEEKLYLPSSAGDKCALLIRISAGEDVSAEIAPLLAENCAVFVCYADQPRLERDKAACAAWQAQLDATLDRLLAEHPNLDPQRLYVDGWLSAYLIFHSGRFAAAIQRPALINPTTAYGNCAAGWVEPFGSTLEEMMLTLAGQSVLTDVDACTTPCLVVYQEGNADYSREQSEELYGAMKDRNPDVPCRMAVFTPEQWEKRGMQEIIGWIKRFPQEGGVQE